MKQLCKEFDIQFLVGAQLSRAVENRASKRPILSDLRESGSLEQDADNVWFIYHDDEGNTELINAKHRNGPVGSIKMKFIPQLTQFKDEESGVFMP